LRKRNKYLELINSYKEINLEKSSKIIHDIGKKIKNENEINNQLNVKIQKL
jgi:ribosomal protein L18E